MVPDGWKVRSISDVLEKVSTPVEIKSTELYREIGIRSHGKGIFHKEPTSGKSIGNKRVFHIEPDCLVVNIVFAWEQAVAKTSSAELGMIASHRFPMFKPKTNRCDINYILYFFKTKKGKYLLELASPGGAGRNKTLGQSEFAKLRFTMPPIEEQQKIATILSTWDKAITTTEQLLANSQQQKKALMQQLLTGKKRLLDKDGVRFSGEFKRYHFSDLLEIDRKSLGSKTDPNLEFDYISLSDVGTGTIPGALERHIFKTSPSRARRIVSPGDILLATVRPNLQGFAKVREQHEHCIASTGFAVLTPKKGTCGDYVYHYLFGSHITGQINALVVGTNYPAINSSDVSGLCIYCPHYEEQIEIAKVLNSSDELINALQQKLEALKQEKKALMQQLLTGKRRVLVS
tara:strand:+ start:891 stop:2099 length:1209 start_codon:yes stop_codon:yes gene_type:complete